MEIAENGNEENGNILIKKEKRWFQCGKSSLIKEIIRIPNNKFEVLCFLKVLHLTLTGLLLRSQWTWTHMIGVLKTNAIIDAVKDWGYYNCLTVLTALGML